MPLENQKGLGKRRERSQNKGSYNELDPNQNGKRGKLNDGNPDEPLDETSDSRNSESTRNNPSPPSRSKASDARGPETPSVTTERGMKSSGSTPDSTPTKPVVALAGKGAVKCLFYLIDEECKESLRKLNGVASLSESESEKHSIDELVKSGARLSKHGEEIQKLGERLLSISEDRFNKFKKGEMTRPSQFIAD